METTGEVTNIYLVRISPKRKDNAWHLKNTRKKKYGNEYYTRHLRNSSQTMAAALRMNELSALNQGVR